MGQYIKVLKAKLSEPSMLESIKDNNDAVRLLCSIIGFVFKFEAHKNVHVSTWALKQNSANVFQKKLNLIQFMDKCMGNVVVMEQT